MVVIIQGDLLKRKGKVDMHETGSYSSQLSITVTILPTTNNQLMKGKDVFDSAFSRCPYMTDWSCAIVKSHVGECEIEREA